MRVIFGSDFHLDLHTEGINRKQEILSIIKYDMIEYAIKEREKTGEDFTFVFGGDIFNHNKPTEESVGDFIGVLDQLRIHKFPVYVMVGNHDEIADPERLSCLSFIKKLGSAFSNVKLIEDITVVPTKNDENGKLYYLFLPHISSALLKKKRVPEGTTTQQYIDNMTKKIMDKVVANSGQMLVFSHLNIKGAYGGSEENLLNKSTVYLPRILTDNLPVGYSEPTIIQAHIHSRNKLGNIHIVGNQFYCGFGEKESAKYFADIQLPRSIGDDVEVNYIETSCVQFRKMQVDVLDDTTPFLLRQDVQDFLASVDHTNSVIKFDVTVSVANSLVDWKQVQKDIQSKYKTYIVKPIMPRVIVERRKRSREQKIGLDPKDSVKVYLKRNFRKDENKMKRLYAMAVKFL